MIDEEKIIAYVMEELEEPERREVAAALEKDESLRKIAEKYRQIKAGFRAKRVQNLAEQIAAYEDTLANEAGTSSEPVASLRPVHSRRPLLAALLVAASLALLIGFFYTRFNYSDAALAQKYFELPADPAVAGNQDVSTFSSALEAFFNDQDYQKAAALFAAIPDSSAYAPQARYFEAHADFLQGNYEEARSKFTALSGQLENYPRDQQRKIEWNIMISRLALGEEVGPLPDTPEGKALQRDLNSFWQKVQGGGE